MRTLTILFALVFFAGCKTNSVVWYTNSERNYSIRLDADADILDFNLDLGHLRNRICGYEFQELNDSVLILTQIYGPSLQENPNVDSICDVKRTITCYIDNDTILLKASGSELFVTVFGEKISFSRWGDD